MSKPTITAHTIVKNESRWIWYSLTSVLRYVDEILVWDTGSTDDTVAIINSLSSPKIRLHLESTVTPSTFTLYRQRMLQQTHSDWLLILDGDEVWTPSGLTSSLSFISSSSPQYDYLISSYYNLLGDVYHRQVEAAGRYQLGSHKGHISIRFVNLKTIPGLHFARPYGREGLFDKYDTPLQDRKNVRSAYVSDPYLHMTHLRRSSLAEDTAMMRRKKFKYELGVGLPRNFVYPRCFYQPRPDLVLSPWPRRSLGYFTSALWQTPIKRFRRHFIF